MKARLDHPEAQKRPLPGATSLRHLDHVISRRQRRQRELGDPPSAAVGIIARGGRDRHGKRLPRAIEQSRAPGPRKRRRKLDAQLLAAPVPQVGRGNLLVAGRRAATHEDGAGRIRELRQHDPQRFGRRAGGTAAFHTHPHEVLARGQRRIAQECRPEGAGPGQDARVHGRQRSAAGGRQQQVGVPTTLPLFAGPELAHRPHRAGVPRLPTCRGMQANRQRTSVSLERRDSGFNRPRLGGGGNGQRVPRCRARRGRRRPRIRFGGREVPTTSPNLHAGPLHPDRDRVELAIEPGARVVTQQIVGREIGHNPAQPAGDVVAVDDGEAIGVGGERP